MKIVYLGNHEPRHSTETHIGLSLESLGHEVIRVQEGSLPAWKPAHSSGGSASHLTILHKPDLFLWTQTISLAEKMGDRESRLKMLREIHQAGIPTAGFHLDRWWGLSRETRVRVEPYFQVQYLFTADGGHQPEWASQGINHIWLPPGVYHGEAQNGTPRPDYTARVAFVGSWEAYGHKEYAPIRKEMIETLTATYGDDFRPFPPPGSPRIVYPDLNDLYASVEVVVGDSCLAPRRDGQPIPFYWSDRVSETTGRGGFLIHPYVEGLETYHPSVPTWPLGDIDAMLALVRRWLDDPEGRVVQRTLQSEETRERNTYRDRCAAMLNYIFDSQTEA